MSGQAGKLQPGGQIDADHSLVSKSAFWDPTWVWLVLAWILLAVPFNRGGLWDPHELRIAEVARRLSIQLFHAQLPVGIGAAARVTTAQLEQGEMAFTSPALAFAVFGVSDWAGRLASLFWGSVALLSLWYLMGRTLGRFAQVMSALVLTSMPLFAWQTRTMLGEAPTMGTTALALAGLLLVTFDGVERHHEPNHRPIRLCVHWIMSLVGLAAGVLCRGVLFGVAVPCLAVGFIGVVTLGETPQHRVRRRFAFMTLASGLLAALLGLLTVWSAPNGYSRLLGASLSLRGVSTPFDVPFTDLVHELFPVSAFLPIAAAIVLSPSTSRKRKIRERAIPLALLWSILLSVAAAVTMGFRNVVVPFGGTVAAAGLAGTALLRMHRREVSSAAMGVFVLTFSSMLLGDFVNFPDKSMLVTGMRGAHLPLGFQSEAQYWAGGAVAALCFGCVPVILAPLHLSREPLLVRSRYRAVAETLQRAFSGQLISALVLVETALGTTALLDRANARGWINASFFDLARSLVGPLLAWAWLLPPVIFIAIPFAYTTVDIAIGRLIHHRHRPEPHVKNMVGAPPWVLNPCSYSMGLVLGIGLVVSGLVLTLGHGVAIAEQLSPKRAIVQYREHAKAHEPLGVLGVKSDALGFYVSTPPTAFDDIEVAARWLHEPKAPRRWLAFGADRLAEVNGAYRSVTDRHNLVILDGVAGNLILGTSRLGPQERDQNPLGFDVLATAPPTARATSVQFGEFCRLLGWEIRGNDGLAADSLVVGTRYEFRLVFQVLGTTNVDWQIFIHIDGHGRRHNGDHDPVMGRYPTTLWQPGDIILDRHPIAIDRGSFLGEHSVYMGLFRGNKRLDVISGQADENRVRLGTVSVE
ncbi:MAG TPA: glycosyltransferase family 39 protein [Polyangiaceae bacterium]